MSAELFAALAKAQAQMKNVTKENVNSNPAFKGAKYADLASVWDAIRKPLTDNGLSIIQVGDLVDGHFVLRTILAHSSGQSVTSIMPLQPTQNTPQAMGSEITYKRRYALQAITGIAPEDDDGEHASRGAPAPQRTQPRPASYSTQANRPQQGASASAAAPRAQATAPAKAPEQPSYMDDIPF